MTTKQCINQFYGDCQNIVLKMMPFVKKNTINDSYESFVQNNVGVCVHDTGLILGLRRANERQCYFVTESLIGWAQT